MLPTKNREGPKKSVVQSVAYYELSRYMTAIDAVKGIEMVVGKLPAFDKVTTAHKALIANARAAYNKLNADQKANVAAETLKKLEAAEDKMVILQAMGEAKAKAKVTYKKATTSKAKKQSGYKVLSVNGKTGKVTVKAGAKPGTYKLMVVVTAAKTANTKAATRTVTVTVKVTGKVARAAKSAKSLKAQSAQLKAAAL